MTDGPLDPTIYADADTRIDLWKRFLNHHKCETVLELGVFRGEFAEQVLNSCSSIKTYYMLDPWRHLDDWNKPANSDDDTFEKWYGEAMKRTKRHASKRVVLRGRTTEVLDEVPDESLDFGYVDGDHTLRGVTIDLIKMWPKVRPGGFLGGDDFRRSMWQHEDDYEPTLVFPWAVYFAEAVGARIWALPKQQFLIQKIPATFEFIDLTTRYTDTTIRAAMKRGRRRQAAAARASESEDEARSA